MKFLKIKETFETRKGQRMQTSQRQEMYDRVFKLFRSDKGQWQPQGQAYQCERAGVDAALPRQPWSLRAPRGQPCTAMPCPTSAVYCTRSQRKAYIRGSQRSTVMKRESTSRRVIREGDDCKLSVNCHMDLEYLSKLWCRQNW